MLIVSLNLPLWGVVGQEFTRWAAVSVSNGMWASLGVVIGEEVLIFDGDITKTALRIMLLIAPQIALGLFWQRYGLIGGIAAIAEHLAWNQWLGTAMWPVPTVGMLVIYAVLIFSPKEFS